jgi:hypothetical protein
MTEIQSLQYGLAIVNLGFIATFLKHW